MSHWDKTPGRLRTRCSGRVTWNTLECPMPMSRQMDVLASLFRLLPPGTGKVGGDGWIVPRIAILPNMWASYCCCALTDLPYNRTKLLTVVLPRSLKQVLRK